MIPLLAIIIGLLIGLFITVNLPGVVYSYLALTILCTFDSMIGGIKARYARRYSPMMFITGWIGNIVIALMMNALGEALGLELSTPVVILLGMRIFDNIAGLRRLYVKRLEKRQRTFRVWIKKTSLQPEELPLETVAGQETENSMKVIDLRQRARLLRLEADSLLNEADTLQEQEAMAELARSAMVIDAEAVLKTAEEAPKDSTADTVEEAASKTCDRSTEGGSDPLS